MDTKMRICLPVLLAMCHFASSVQSSLESDYSVGVNMFLNAYSQCQSDEPINCLKMKFLRLADRMLNAPNVTVFDGVDLIAKPGSESRSLSFDQDEAPLYSSNLSEDEKESKIDSLIWHRLHAILKSKSLAFNMRKLVEKSRALIGGEETEEEVGADGRGKKEKKKKGYVLLAAMMMKGTLIAVTLKALALLAGKALVVSKIALTLALLLAIKKLFSPPPQQKTTYEIVKTPVVSHSHEYSHHGYSGGDEHDGYARSLDKEEIAKRHISATSGRPTPTKFRYSFEPVPTLELTTPKLPSYYISEEASEETADNDTFQNSLSNPETPTFSGNKWSTKLSETVEPIGVETRPYSTYGYRNARFVNSGEKSGLSQVYRGSKTFASENGKTVESKDATKLTIVVPSSFVDGGNKTSN